MNYELGKISSSLVEPTFFDKLHIKQGFVKKEFVELKNIDADKQNQAKLQQGESKDEWIVFNYLWCHFPEVMATKNQDPKLLRQEIGNSEFEKILKVAKRFYGFRVYASWTILAASFIGTVLSSDLLILDPVLATISFAICLGIGCPLLVITHDPYFSPDSLSIYEQDRRDYLRSLYKNTPKQYE